MSNPLPPSYTTRQLMARWHVSRARITAIARRYKWQAVSVGTAKVYAAEDVAAYEAIRARYQVQVAWQQENTLPPGLPPDAVGGLWDCDKEDWRGEWYYSTAEMQEAADGVARSGFSLCVLNRRGKAIETSGF